MMYLRLGLRLSARKEKTFVMRSDAIFNDSGLFHIIGTRIDNTNLLKQSKQ